MWPSLREHKGTEFVWKLRKTGFCEGVRRAFILIYARSCSHKMNLHGCTSTTPLYGGLTIYIGNI